MACFQRAYSYGNTGSGCRNFFFLKNREPRAIALLKRGCIEPIQKFTDGIVYLDQAEEFHITELGDDMAGHIAYIALYSCFVLRRKYSGWQDSHVVVVSEFLVGLVGNGIFMLAIGHNSCLQIVRDQKPGRAAEKLYHMDIGVNPGLLLHVGKSFSKAVHAERQCPNEDVDLGNSTSFRVVQQKGLSSPVHHHLVTGLMLDVHGQAVAIRIVTIQLTEL